MVSEFRSSFHKPVVFFQYGLQALVGNGVDDIAVDTGHCLRSDHGVDDRFLRGLDWVSEIWTNNEQQERGARRDRKPG